MCLAYAEEKPEDGEGKTGCSARTYNSIQKESEITTMFQPIISLQNGCVFGYEALSRGPKGSEWESPSALFEAARIMGNLWELELICRVKALKAFSNFHKNTKIFLNVDPDIIYEEKFKSGFTKELLNEYGLRPENVVFEVTERKSISNMEAFLKILDHYRDQGYQIAIDDAGAGYSGLNLIADIHPHFIKLDMKLVRDIDKTGLKYALVKNLNEFCQVTGIKMVAEGIETEEELRALVNIGVNYGQGFYLQVPREDLNPLDISVTKKILELNAKRNILYRSNCSMIRAGDIASQCPTVKPNTPGEEVKDIFLKHPVLFGIPVVEQGKLCGLIMRDKFFSQLGTQYGYSLYYKRPVRLLMDPRPLTVEDSTSLDTTSKLITARSNDCIYDLVIVVKDGLYHGVVTVKDILQKTMEIEVNHAKHLNPLTSLPGNLLIEKQLEDTVKSDEPYTVLYVDIDNFKAYNDVYGFENGDKVLQFMKEVLTKSVMADENIKDYFIGHIGGDDFVIILNTYETEHICAMLLKNFMEIRSNFYNMEDQTRQYIMAKDRHGNKDQFNLMTISIAGISNRFRCFTNVFELSEQVSKIKTECKSRGGNCCIISGNLSLQIS